MIMIPTPKDTRKEEEEKKKNGTGTPVVAKQTPPRPWVVKDLASQQVIFESSRSLVAATEHIAAKEEQLHEVTGASCFCHSWVKMYDDNY